MLVGVLTEKYINDCNVDVIELRIDLIDDFNIDDLAEILKKINYPVIITVRSKIDGGNYLGSEEQRLQLLLDAAKLNPEYIDLEHHLSVTFISLIKQISPNIKIIRSYHNFNSTPVNICELLDSLIYKDVFCYKIVTKANCFLDNIRIIDLLKKYNALYKLSAHCLGNNSLFSRILGRIYGGLFIYAQINKENNLIADCPDLYALQNIYNISKINKNTVLYALIGNPVEHSIGHIFHNAIFKKYNLNQTYLKITLNEHEIDLFFKKIKYLPIKGLSVTTPLKHIVARYLESDDYAINTISISDNRISTINTDSKGGIDALLDITYLESKVVFIVGAGSVARMVAEEILKYTNKIIIINRSKTDLRSYRTYDFNTISECDIKPDILINAIPSVHNKLVYSVLKPFLSENLVYLGIDYTKAEFNIAEKISDFGCKVISPITFFEKQALRQLRFWEVSL